MENPLTPVVSKSVDPFFYRNANMEAQMDVSPFKDKVTEKLPIQLKN